MGQDTSVAIITRPNLPNRFSQTCGLTATMPSWRSLQFGSWSRRYGAQTQHLKGLSGESSYTARTAPPAMVRTVRGMVYLPVKYQPNSASLCRGWITPQGCPQTSQMQKIYSEQARRCCRARSSAVGWALACRIGVRSLPTIRPGTWYRTCTPLPCRSGSVKPDKQPPGFPRTA